MAKKVMTGNEIIKYFESRFPKSLAMDNDPIGLQVGSLNKPVRTILVALDVDQRVCDEAVAKGVDLIIAHHPLIYRPLQQVATETPKGKIIAQLIKHDISVYAAHTNLDIATDGLNDWLAAQVGIENTRVLAPTATIPLVKFVGYVPTTHLEVVQAAVLAANTYELSGYRDCSFTSVGTGSFTAVTDSQPFIGKIGERTNVAEAQLALTVPQTRVEHVIAAYKQAHPYEVPAYETFILQEQGVNVGLGRIGELAQPTSLNKFIEHMKQAFNLPHLRIVGAKPDKRIQTVAVLGGSGSGYWHQAKRQKADIYLTGDIGYHDAQEAVEAQMMIADIGHFAEHVCKQHLHKILTNFIEGQNKDTVVMMATSEADPFEIW